MKTDSWIVHFSLSIMYLIPIN